MEIVELVEIDIPFCSLTYGVAPCAAELGVTGERKCFNTRRTCQDRENFDPEPLTLRFIRPSVSLDYDAIPSLEGVSITPQEIDPGVSMGKRESVRVTFGDHPHSDAGLDKYLSERGYDAFKRGTFWGKLRARVTTLKGLPLRILRGEAGTPLAEMTVSHYLIESAAGPDGRTFSITAKDVLKVADGDRAQAPAVSRGELGSAIGDTGGSFSLVPTGIGDLDYPSSGKAVIGGSEIVSFTRTGDAVTLTARGVSNTDPTEHDAGEAFQVVLEYDAETPANIIYDLLTTYTGADPTWIPLADWQEEVDQFIGRLYSAQIAEPTPVRKLINELIDQCGLVFWTDVTGPTIKLQALRPIASSAEVYDLDRIMEGTFRQKDQPNKRISQSWTYYGLINPLEQLDNRLGYQFAAIQIDLESELEHNDEAAIRKVYSRWIDAGNRAAAQRLNELKIARYREAPRRFEWSVFRTDPATPQLGAGVFVRHRALQDDTGSDETPVPVQIVSVEPARDRWVISAEEMVFSGDVGTRTVFIDVDAYQINLRALYDEIYTAPTQYDTVTFVVASGVQIGTRWVIGSQTHTTMRAITVGDWPEGPTIRLINNGIIVGGGGAGKDARVSEGTASTGAHAIYTRVPITITNNGLIAGGGGGGGRSSIHGGGGGAGARQEHPNAYGDHFAPGGPNADWSFGSDSHGRSGTLEFGGAADGDAGDGGDLGQPGENGVGGPNQTSMGGPAGNAIDGDSFVTFDVEGDIRGPRIN